MKTSIKFLTTILISLISFSLHADSRNTKLKKYLKKHFNYVERIENFYIVGLKDRPLETEGQSISGKKAHEMAVKQFKYFLDRNKGKKIDDSLLVEALGKHFIFLVGYDENIAKHEEEIHEIFGLYAMSMKTDIWPIFKSKKKPIINISKLDSSMWRPENYSALWEEVFHTLTEASFKIYPEMSIQKGSKLHTLIIEDIDNGIYNISEQNEEENGGYDLITACNEYLHQIWLIAYFGDQKIFRGNQKLIWSIMQKNLSFVN